MFLGDTNANGTKVTAPTGGAIDPNLQGPLNAGTFAVSFGSGADAGTAAATVTEYGITYTIGGVAYTGTLATGGNVAGATISAGTTLTLHGAGGDATDAVIALKVGAGVIGVANADNRGAIQAALQSNFAAATGTQAAFTATPVITQPVSGNDASLNSNLSGGSFTATAQANLAADGTDYNIAYLINGVTYSGRLVGTGTASAAVAAGQTVTLTAPTDSHGAHASIKLTVGPQGFGVTNTSVSTVAQGKTVSQAANIAAALNKSFSTATTTLNGAFSNVTSGAALNVGTSAFTSGGLLIAPPTTSGVLDSALHGDLSQGTFTASLGAGTLTANGSTGTASQYTITYTIHGTTYTGTLATAATGRADVASGTFLALTSTDSTKHSIIYTKTASAFGNSTSPDQSTNIVSALNGLFAGATAESSNTSATVNGQVAAAGVSFSAANNDAKANDTAFVGDLSKGVFSATGDATAGYSVSYALGGSTYQGRLSGSEVTNGGTLVLDNGVGSLSFAVTASSVASPNASTASATAFQAALTSIFAGATAFATHTVATTLAKDSNGANIAGSAITAASTAGTLLDGFSGANIKITSATFSGNNLPPISSVTATGSGSSTVFSILVGGVTYSTQGTVSPDGRSTLAGTTFDGNTGILTFYKNGDKATNPNEKVVLDFSAATGANISAAAKIGTTDEVTQVTDALNTLFGSGGSAGGLTFQLGTSTLSDVTVNIASAKTSALYAGATLDISTAGGAGTAALTVGSAIDTLTSLRAGVGALESQFNFASAAIQSGTQNQDAARGSLLDTDISTESTAYATNQVKLQAGISVLAQANQQLQALLKLIG